MAINANKRLLSVSQNVESVSAAFSGLKAMYDQFETLEGKPTGKVAAGMKRSLRDAMEPTAQKYTEIVTEKINNEAQVASRSFGTDSVLRHLYAGGHPNNMGDKDAALFSVKYKKLSKSKGWGFEPYISTKVDTAASFSSITGSNKHIVANEGKLSWGDYYKPWRERAAAVYSGVAVGGSRPSGLWYLTGANPSTEGVASKPPEKVYSSPEFTRSYAQHANFFRKWWEEELAVTGFEMIEAYDRSQSTALLKTFSELVKEVKSRELSQGATRARASVAGRRSSSEYRAFAGTKDMIETGDQKMAVKMSRVLYRELAKQLEVHVGGISKLADKPAPAVEETEIMNDREYFESGGGGLEAGLDAYFSGDEW